MKKLICLIMAVIFITGCRQEAPALYSYYEDFVAEKQGAEITPADVTKYTDITNDQSRSVLKDRLELKNLTGHRVYTTKTKAVVNFYFTQNAGHNEIDTALKYGFETFWLGEMHTSRLLPYEDWQYSHRIKELVVQIFSGDMAVVQEVYTFDNLTDGGEKLYKKIRTVNNDVVFYGTFINLGEWLKGSEEQLAQYTNIDAVAGLPVYTAMRQPLDKDSLIVSLTTDERQIAPEKLNDVYDAVYERYSFINENMTVQLYMADQSMYFEYSGYVDLPQGK